MSSSIWSVGSLKKSILFDVLFVMDRANKIKSKKVVGFEYSLLKAETVKKYDALYKVAINQSDLLAAAFHISKYKEKGKHDTIIHTYLFEKALEMVSFIEMTKFLEKITVEELAYYIAAECLSTKEKIVTKEEIGEIVKQGDRKLIEVLYKTSLPDKIKMSIYMMIFSYDKFLITLINYMKKLHKYVQNLYIEYSDVYQNAKKRVTDFMNEKSKRTHLIQDIKEKINDEKQRKHVIVVSLIRLEYSRITHTKSTIDYNKGIFALQRIMQSDGFVIF